MKYGVIGKIMVISLTTLAITSPALAGGGGGARSAGTGSSSMARSSMGSMQRSAMISTSGSANSRVSRKSAAVVVGQNDAAGIPGRHLERDYAR